MVPHQLVGQKSVKTWRGPMSSHPRRIASELRRVMLPDYAQTVFADFLCNSDAQICCPLELTRSPQQLTMMEVLLRLQGDLRLGEMRHNMSEKLLC